MKNPFSPKTRELFFYNYSCFWCNQNKWDALHHILGRESNSPYNACPIHNFGCHLGNAKLDTFEQRCNLLKKTKAYLDSEGYIPTQQDKEFLKRNKKYYDS